MKRTLTLIRHAKSSWQDNALPDIERPLNDRGQRDAPFMAKHMANSAPKPDCLISSPAKRAYTTACIYAEAFGLDTGEVLVDERIYEAPVSRLMDVVNSLNDRCERVVLFGHNPGFSYLVEYLTGELVHMPTNGVVSIEMDIDSWEHAGTGCGSIVLHDFPKQHKELL